jgi:hypothetical protein
MLGLLGRRSESYKQTFKSSTGKWVLGDIMRVSRYRAGSFVSGKPDETAFNEGARSVVSHVVDMCEMTSEDIKRIADTYAHDEEKDRVWFEGAEERDRREIYKGEWE